MIEARDGNTPEDRREDILSSEANTPPNGQQDPRFSTLFYDGGSDSADIVDELRRRNENCLFFDVRTMRFPADEPMAAPTLYAPEGTFTGAREIWEIFLRLRPESRWK